jgi:hypothetical protein
MSREDQFFKMCTTLPFEEVKDSRDEFSVPELMHIAELRDSGQMQEAVDYGRSLMKMYPDNDLIPFMVAYIYYQKDFHEEALKIAIDSIPKCPRRYRLYSVAGLAELGRSRLPEALVWWARSVVAQCTVTDFQESDPFLYLAHAAELAGAGREARIFFTMADAIEPEPRRLAAAALTPLEPLRQSWVRRPLADVLKHIDRTYLHS